MTQALTDRDYADDEYLDLSDDLDLPLFVSHGEVASAQELLRTHKIDLAAVAGLTDEELEAVYAKGMELLRLGMHREGGRIFFALVLLRPTEGRFYRGLGLAYHYQRMFNWARIVYGQALAYAPGDVATLALRAECTLLTVGKREALQELTDVLTAGPRNRHDVPYVERARALANKLSFYREEI